MLLLLLPDNRSISSLLPSSSSSFGRFVRLRCCFSQLCEALIAAPFLLFTLLLGLIYSTVSRQLDKALVVLLFFSLLFFFFSSLFRDFRDSHSFFSCSLTMWLPVCTSPVGGIRFRSSGCRLRLVGSIAMDSC
jgi:hypothetical protein